jgi:hypothetical protein
MALGGRRATTALVVALALATGLAACGDDDDDAAEPAATTASAASGSETTRASEGSGDTEDTEEKEETGAATDTTTAAPAGSATTAAGGSASGGARERCPLTAEQVGDVLGVEVAEEGGACLFFPTNGKLVPSALYVQQVAFACRDDVRSEVGYDEPFEGLGVDAYVQAGTADGTMLLVCTEPPFEVSVDQGVDDAAARAQVEELARLVLDG